MSFPQNRNKCLNKCFTSRLKSVLNCSDECDGNDGNRSTGVQQLLQQRQSPLLLHSAAD